ncbi:phage tail tube protein, partial [Aliamphritea spongicola]|uniref:phage tail tube protein n=1 Tax=Aliamphritea spongicola TaxID=707589 RepID=UPI00196B14BA
DELPTFGFDGGDTEVQGTWSNATFREVVTEAPADYVTFNALQFDEQVLGLYYGVEDTTPGDEIFEVQNAPISTVPRALLVVIVDGPRRVAFHA